MTRRGRALGLAAALGLLGWTGMSLARLARAEAARDAAAAGPGTLALVAPRTASIVTADPGDAARRLATLLGDGAAAAGVRLALVALPATEPAGVVRLRLVASGEEARVRRFAAAAEAGPPAVRWSRWSLAALPGGQVRLEADAVAPWRAR